jgi:hypothetical protein
VPFTYATGVRYSNRRVGRRKEKRKNLHAVRVRSTLAAREAQVVSLDILDDVACGIRWPLDIDRHMVIA